MRRLRAVLFGTCVIATCLSGGAAPAHGPTGDGGPTGTIVRTLPLDLDHVLERAQDPGTPSVSTAGECLSLPRSPSDRPDFEAGPQVHVIYMVPSNADDEELDTDGTLECSIRAQNQWLAEQTGGLEWRLDTFLMETTVAGEPRTVAVPDITFVRSPQPASELSNAGGVSRELEARGFDDPGKRYLTYVAAGSGGVCGDAFYPIPRLDQPWSGMYAQVYVNGAAGCGTNRFGVPGAPSYSESVAQQELMHNDGMTPIGAPHSCPNGSPPGFAHVCTAAIPVMSLDPERFDVMYPFAGVPLSQKKLDLGNDDYYRHSLPLLLDLEDSPFLRPASSRPAVPQGGEPEPAPQPSSAPSPAPSPSPSAEPTPSPTPAPSASPTPSPSPSEEPAESAPDVARTISLEVSETVVDKGDRVRFSGKVTGEGCAAGAEVVLEARRPAEEEFHAVRTTSTASDGTFRVRLRVRRTQVFRAAVAATEGCQAAVSAAVKIRVVR